MAYTTLIGVGVSTNIHWFSDVVGGGLIGAAIGSTVGLRYEDWLNPDQKEQTFNFLHHTGRFFGQLQILTIDFNPS